MSLESRLTSGLRRSKKEPERPDYSEPDFSGWAQKLDNFIPPSKAATKTAPKPADVAAAVEAPVEAPAPVAEAVAAPVAPAVDERPSLEAVLEKLLSFDGAMCVALVDSETGMILGKAGSGVDIDLAAAGASVTLRARLASIKALGGDEHIEDVLISLTSQVQIIHPLPRNPSIFTYLIGDQEKSRLAMARFKAAEADLQIQL
jgi:predicted regulator of Ras-like GTPase activity (Roadblock/LC7/MglB family)